jgi:hypothetical protein
VTSDSERRNNNRREKDDMGKASRKAKRKLKANSDSVAPYRVQKMDLEDKDELITNLGSELPIDGVDEKEMEGEEEEGAPKVITRGSILQRHKLEYRKQREEVRELKDRR